MKRILFVIPYLCQGGAQKVTTLVANELVERWGYQIAFFTLDNQHFYKELAPSLVEHFYVPETTMIIEKSFFRLYIGLLQHLKTHSYDLIISGCEGTSEISLFLLRYINNGLCNKANFISIIHTPISKIYQFSSWSHKLGWKILKYTRLFTFDCVSVVSQMLLEDPFLQAIKCKVLIHNPLDIKKLNNLASEIPKDGYQIPVNMPFFLYVGRISPEKNPLLLLEGFNLIKNSCNHCLILLGAVNDKKLFKQIKIFIDTYLKGRAFYLGPVQNPYLFMKNADALISTSHYESFLLVAFEAMFLNCIVISTKFEGYDHLFTNDHALLINCNDIDALVKALKKVIEKDSHLNNLRKNAHQLALQYSLPVIANQYHCLFSERLKNKFNCK